MSLTINHNITSLNAWRNLTQTDRATGRSMEKLSSGLRINRASDDPAGLVISEKMRAQLSGLSAAAKNVEKAINVVSTAEAALDKVNSLLGKMRSLAIDSANLGVNDSAMLKANQEDKRSELMSAWENNPELPLEEEVPVQPFFSSKNRGNMSSNGTHS